jgi:hypothetical protein
MDRNGGQKAPRSAQKAQKRTGRRAQKVLRDAQKARKNRPGRAQKAPLSVQKARWITGQTNAGRVADRAEGANKKGTGIEPAGSLFCSLAQSIAFEPQCASVPINCLAYVFKLQAGLDVLRMMTEVGAAPKKARRLSSRGRLSL